MKKAIVWVLTVLMVFSLLGCGNGSPIPASISGDPVARFKQQVEEGDYAAAVETYEEKLEGNSSRETAAADFLEEWLEEAYDAYLAGQLSDTEMSARLRTAEKVDEAMDAAGKTISGIRGKVDRIAASRKAFAEGERLLAAGDWLAAWEAFGRTDALDKENHQQAADKQKEALAGYEDQVIREAEERFAQGDLEGAAELLFDRDTPVGVTQRMQDCYEEGMLRAADAYFDQGKASEGAAVILEAEDRVGATQRLESGYEDGVVRAAEALFAAGNSDAALAAVMDAESWLGETEKLEECLVKGFTAVYSAAVTERFAAGDHPGVLRAYREAVENGYAVIDSNMTDMAAKSRTAYLEAAAAKAAEAFGDDKDYEAALAALRTSLAEVSDLDDLVAGLEELSAGYREYIPVALTSLEYTQKTKYIGVGGRRSFDDNKDANGKVYNKETMICPIGGSLNGEYAKSEDDGYVIYNLNFRYTVLEGVIYMPYTALSSKGEWKEPTVVRIYGDDVLLYEAPVITKDSYDPIPFTVDVSGVRNLKIVMLGTWASNTSNIGIYDFNPKVCMAEVTVRK